MAYKDFLDKELILFSRYDNARSIPCVIDGFKPSQRKVLFGAFLRNLVREIKVVQFVVPPSVTGMCLYLGIDRSTWQNYADAALHPELAGICQGARTRIEAYLEQELLTREKGVQGIIFNLQNNYGWKQKQEVELGKDTRESMKHAATYHEKLALLRADDGESECDEDEVDGL